MKYKFFIDYLFLYKKQKKNNMKKLLFIPYFILILFTLSLMSCCSSNKSVKADEFNNSDTTVVESAVPASEENYKDVSEMASYEEDVNKNHIIIGKKAKNSFHATSSSHGNIRARDLNIGGSGHFVNNGNGSSPISSNNSEINNKNDLGVIAYNIPDTMNVGVEYIVYLRISKKMSRNLTVGFVGDTNKLVIREIRVGGTMEVKLIETNSSEESFKITTLSSGIQNIESDSSYTTWEWSIRPIKGGIHKLKMIVVIKGGDFTKDIPVYEDEIYIQNSSIFIVKNFISKNWQWLGGSIIIPLIIFFWKRREDKKGEKKKISKKQ